MATPRTGRPRGRPKGAKNKKSEGFKQIAAAAGDLIANVLGERAFTGDAHALMMAIYKDTALPLETRLDAAKAAIRFEKPTLSAISLPENRENREDNPGDGAKLINGHAQVIDNDPLISSLKAWGNANRAN